MVRNEASFVPTKCTTNAVAGPYDNKDMTVLREYATSLVALLSQFFQTVPLNGVQ